MSYDLYLKDPVTGDVCHADSAHELAGGTYALGGTTELWLNITYNYAKHFHSVLGEGGIRSIYGKNAAATVPVLEAAAAKLKDDVHPDYWEPTEGNAKRAILQLVELARMRPDAVWDGD